MKKVLLSLALACIAISSYAQVPPIRGEVSAGVYKNIVVDSNGYLITTAGGSGTAIVIVSPTRGTMVNKSGTITTGGTAQTIAVANPSRSYLFIQNTSDTAMWCNFTTAAVVTQPSFTLIPGASFVMESGYVSTELVSCIGPTTGKTFTAKEG